MKFNFTSLLLATVFTVGAIGAAQATPGFIALEGSDATTFHRDPVYTPELFKYLQGSSVLPVLVYNSSGASDLSAITGGVATVNVSSLVGVTLANYSAIYVQTPGTCCTANVNALNGFGVAINAFIAAGGNLSIGNYGGGSFDGVVPGGDLTGILGAVEGVGAQNNGAGGGPTCTDGEITNAAGLAKGFTQPPVDGCWSHQAYELSYWVPFGYLNLIDSSTDYLFGDGTNLGSSFLALGGTLGSHGVPEPLTLSLFGAGLAGAFAMRRKSKKD